MNPAPPALSAVSFLSPPPTHVPLMARIPPLLLGVLVAAGCIYTLWLRSFAVNGLAVRLLSPKFRWGPSQGKNLNLAIIDVADMVNVFIGTTNGGHVFPGATLPHGMVKVGMDTDSPGNVSLVSVCLSFRVRLSLMVFCSKRDTTLFLGIALLVLVNSTTKERVVGFHSQILRYGLLPAVPHLSNARLCWSIGKYSVTLNHDGAPADRGSPGYFATHLTNGVGVELTATRRASLHRYIFNHSSASPPIDPTLDNRPRILVDITNDGRQTGTEAKAIVVPETGRVMGSARFLTSFGLPDAAWSFPMSRTHCRWTNVLVIFRYNAFVCTDFEVDGKRTPPIEYGTYSYDDISPNTTTLGESRGGGQKGVLLTFPSNPSGLSTVLVRVGVSFISTDQACRNAEEEIPSFNFESVARSAREQWTELLNRIQVDLHGVQMEHAVLFYSSLYRSHIAPADCECFCSPRYVYFGALIYLPLEQFREKIQLGAATCLISIRYIATCVVSCSYMVL